MRAKLVKETKGHLGARDSFPLPGVPGEGEIRRVGVLAHHCFNSAKDDENGGRVRPPYVTPTAISDATMGSWASRENRGRLGTRAKYLFACRKNRNSHIRQ